MVHGSGGGGGTAKEKFGSTRPALITGGPHALAGVADCEKPCNKIRICFLTLQQRQLRLSALLYKLRPGDSNHYIFFRFLFASGEHSEVPVRGAAFA